VLEDNIRKQLETKRFLLMPHMVLGYPSYEENRKAVKTMVEAGAEIIELQIPFSEPMADGPVILKANDEALKRGASTAKSMAFAKEVCAAFPDTMFVFMSYYNVLFAQGVGSFVQKAKESGIQGLIVPDLPPEEGEDYLAACEKSGMSPIFIFTPTSKDERLSKVDQYGRGMAYCVGRKGVTGIKTKMDDALLELIKRYRRATRLPIALGFGIQDKDDVEAIADHVDIVVIGTKLIQLHQEQGLDAVGRFLKELRA